MRRRSAQIEHEETATDSNGMDDELIARLPMALSDASTYPEGDLVRSMAEEVAAADLQELLDRDGLAGIQRLEDELEPSCRRVLCRLTLAMIGRKPSSLTSPAEFMPVMCITVLNHSSKFIPVREETWHDFASAIRGCLVRELDETQVRVEMDWIAVAIEEAGLESASAGLKASILRRRDQASPCHLQPGRTRVLFGPRFFASSAAIDLDTEWDRKAQRVYNRLLPTLRPVIASVKGLGESITVRATPLLPLENVASVVAHEDASDDVVEGEGLYVDEHGDGDQPGNLSWLGPLIDDDSLKLDEAEALLDRYKRRQK